MTENEAIEWLAEETSPTLIHIAEMKKENPMEYINEAVKVACDALEEIQQYREIGTIEEFKALKENERKCEECAGCTEWLCDCANVRAKAIDEFSERLKDSLLHNYRHLLTVDTDGFEWLTTDAVGTHIYEIAEQMKGGE